ncbi:hypothetical protein BGX21_004187, partial [Mortierella sp. AD011]
MSDPMTHLAGYSSAPNDQALINHTTKDNDQILLQNNPLGLTQEVFVVPLNESHDQHLQQQQQQQQQQQINNNNQPILMNRESLQHAPHSYVSEGQLLATSFAMEGVVLSSTASHQNQHFVAVPTAHQQEQQQQVATLHAMQQQQLLQQHQAQQQQQIQQIQQQQQQIQQHIQQRQHMQQMMEQPHISLQTTAALAVHDFQANPAQQHQQQLLTTMPMSPPTTQQQQQQQQLLLVSPPMLPEAQSMPMMPTMT